MQAFAPGLYPRSEKLVQATRDLDRGRTTQEAVDEQVQRDREELIAVQQEAGLDLLTDGMLTWQDVFRPVLEASDGLELGPLTRYLDTNTFYRAPHATTAAPSLSQPLGEREIAPVPGARLVTLPSPFALAQGTGVEPTTIAQSVLKPQIEALDAELVVLSEPFLPRAEKADLSTLSDALEQLAGSAKLVLWFPFADVRELLEQGAADLPVDGIGIDFYATHLTDLPKGTDKLVLAGVVDARSSAVEDARELAEFAQRLQQDREIENLALAPNGDLQFVAEPIAREKLLRLGAAKTATVQAAA
jgi:5-methyltetrahydropteroyltriglutamate--homocysteine methyltransferase